jgi:dihydroorotate dehydrogenase
LAHLGGGGVSGKAAQPRTWGLLETLVGLTDIPVCGPSVWNYQDIAELRTLGASAIDFGSVIMPYPWRPTLYAMRDVEDRRRQTVERVMMGKRRSA